jgi:hypothetical protein
MLFVISALGSLTYGKKVTIETRKTNVENILKIKSLDIKSSELNQLDDLNKK